MSNSNGSNAGKSEPSFEKNGRQHVGLIEYLSPQDADALEFARLADNAGEQEREAEESSRWFVYIAVAITLVSLGVSLAVMGAILYAVVRAFL